MDHIPSGGLLCHLAPCTFLPFPWTMIELRTLGVVDLRAPDGRELRAVLRQPKRLALLAYLAVSSPRRYHRRDSLLALFWPELDEEHARATLRRSLYFLRGELGGEAIASRGDDEIGIPEEQLWCDAGAMDRALAAGDAERALSLYRGDLLEGLHVSGAGPEFHDWLDRERARYRERAAESAQALADQAEREGRLEQAAAWARRALELAPDDEGVLRRLLVLLERSGDRPAAIRAYDEFARRMSQDLELEPSPDTRRLIEAIRSGDHTIAVEADPGRIAILPFSVRGDERLTYLGEGMVELLATQLDGAGEIRTVDPRALLHFVATSDRAPAEPVEPHEARRVAAHFGAGRFLLGSLVIVGERIQGTASLYDASGRVTDSVRAVAGGPTELFQLVDELARQILAVAGVGPGTRLTRIAALTTESLEALRCYLLGERELRAGRYFDAMEAFQAAVEADPSFALAHYRLAAAAAGCALPDVAREFADRGYQHRGRLSPHDQLVFRAQRAWLHGAVPDAESLYNTITGTYPDDVEAWFHLGDILFHTNPLRGRSGVEARAPFERVLRLDSNHLGALVHLARIAGIEGRREDMLALAERGQRLSPEGDQALAMRALCVFAGEDREAMAALAERLQGARMLTVAIAFADVAVYVHHLEGAEMLARSFIQVARSPELRALCHILLAHLALASGRTEDAAGELVEAGRLDYAWGLEMRALFATLPFVDTSREELKRLRSEMEAWDASAMPPSVFLVFAMHNDLHPAIRLWLLTRLSLRLGDVTAALRWQEALSRTAAQDNPMVRSLDVETRAEVARAEGRLDDGIAALETAPPRLWYQLTVAS
ncbi:MAG TPA: BTAD domain-containing putative transcriptional regulator, partial [Myxococcaceae bacterium]